VNSLTRQQQERNEESANGWRLYEHHRNRVTATILNSLPAGTDNRLCLLGAGNCNDVDLRALTDRCREIVLVDLDSEAMLRGVSKQGLSEVSTISVRPNVDLTGVFTGLAEGSTEPALISDLIQTTATYSPEELRGQFHVVASLCLLSQIIDAVWQSVANEQKSIDLVLALRRQHLRIMLEQCVPHGQAILFSEIVSSDTAPELSTTTDSLLPQLLSRLLAEQNFFSGLHPGVIHQELTNDPVLSRLTDGLQLSPPWKWSFLHRTYAVTAFNIARCSIPA
jgi:hypothetical protein